MANYVSPGVYVLEKDTSDYPAAVNPSVVGIVGFASKGPVDKATLITNGERLISIFGKPDEDIIGQGLEGSLEILEATNSLYFVRAAATSAVDASAYVQMGACPAVAISSTIGVTETASISVVVKDANGVAKLTKTFSVPAGSTTTTAALKAVMGGEPSNASKISVYDFNGSAVLVGGFAGSGASLQVSGIASGFVEINASGGGEAAADDVTAEGITFETSSLAYQVESLYPGTGYNYAITNAGVETGNGMSVTTAGGTVGTLNVLQDGVVAESFQVNFVAGEDFIETKINTGGENLKSNIIKGNIYSSGADVTVTALPNFATNLSAMAPVADGKKGSSVFTGGAPPFVKLVAQSGRNLTAGTNGIPDSTDSAGIEDLLVGEVEATGKTGLQVLDNDLLNLSMAAVPGVTSDGVQNALITLAETTKEFLAVVSPPIGFNDVQTAIDWSNGLGDERSSAINSSYAALYWPWVKVFSAVDGVDRWYDPAIFGIRQMCVTDDISETWFAPAGFTRGRLTKPTDVEVTLGQGDRDAMYSDGNVINPIVNFPQQGITIFGQRTTQRAPSALDRINVRRMMLIIRKIILRSTRQFAFEPNDPQTWSQIQALTTTLIDPIARGRGITEYKVTCDSTTNTPDRIEKGELWCKVVIRPTKTAEIIVFELNLINQSASIS